MSIARHHAEWLSLLDISGSFLSLPVLQRTFPQGIESVSSELRADLRAAYTHWADERTEDPTIHRTWVRWLLTGALEHEARLLVEGPTLPPGLERPLPEHHETLRPDLALLSPHDGKPALLVQIYPVAQDLTRPVQDAPWKASPETRMAELLRGTGVLLGLVTNGERWMLVHAPAKETPGYASWYADLWLQEPVTFRAFVSLLRRGRFFGEAEDRTLPALLRESAQDQAEVTDQLGAQVRAAVQVLVQAFDRLDAESGRTLLAAVDGRTLYDAALTVMMRLVFLLSAEERKLIGNEYAAYQQNYAVGSILEGLQEKADRLGEEILERSSDAWVRLLAVFRAIHGGVQHEHVRLPAYGGTLFDPDRFPFLEGRAAGTLWTVHASHPPAVDNRVVLHLLRALQFLESKLPSGGETTARRLSFRGLDVEQIGHVYEGLLDHTARRVAEENVILGLAAANRQTVTLPLERLEKLAAESPESLLKFLAEETGKPVTTLRNALAGAGARPRRGRAAAQAQQGLLIVATQTSQAESVVASIPHALLAACGHEMALARRVAAFAALLRADSFSRPLVILPGSLYIAPGSDRRSTGTHYTPRSLTEPIVQHTLEPLVYHGPAVGAPRGEWRLKTPRELLSLKICDLAMGSGAFLVGACRYLSARLVEAWREVEQTHPGAFITSPEGDLSTDDPSEALLARLPDEERLHLAARAVADRCLYGVDINPMAVEMAKLSLWLITVDRERPFTFLDHALKCGDSLLGISDPRQLERFSLREGDDAQPLLETANLFRHVQQAAELRRQLEATPSHTASQLLEKARLHREAETLLAKLRVAADLLLAAELDSPGDRGWETRRAIAASHMQAGWKKEIAEFQRLAHIELRGRRPFHWPLEFPEVFDADVNDDRSKGFNAFVGNPPFLGGSRISGTSGDDYLSYLLTAFAETSGNGDLVSFFIRRAAELINQVGILGFVTTNSIAQGETRKNSLAYLRAQGQVIFRAVKSRTWPGGANVFISEFHIAKGNWSGNVSLNGQTVSRISSYLDPEDSAFEPHRLSSTLGVVFRGSTISGEGFILTDSERLDLISVDAKSADLIKPFLTGQDINQDPQQRSKRYAIDFGARSEEEARYYSACWQRLFDTVRIQRADNKIDSRVRLWWQYIGRQEELYSAIAGFPRVLGCGQVSKYWGVAWLSPDYVFADKVVVFAMQSSGAFAVLNSCFHTEWADKTSSRLKDDPNYNLAKTFESFVFPTTLSELEFIGERYHEHRRQLMLTRNEGLTKTYNRFHNPDEIAADITELRALHRQLDTTVAAAYGWADLAANDGAALGHDFRDTKQGLRFTLAPAARREVLDRLLSLNHQRHGEEVAAGLHEKKKPKGARKAKHSAAPVAVTMDLDFEAPKAVKPTGEAAFAATLIIGLLSEASRARVSLRMSQLSQAFSFVTHPAAMEEAAPNALRGAVKAWAANWRCAAGEDWFIRTIRFLKVGSVKAATDEDDPPMILTAKPLQPDPPDLREGIRLAVQVVGFARPLPAAEMGALVRERRSIFTTV